MEARECYFVRRQLAMVFALDIAIYNIDDILCSMVVGGQKLMIDEICKHNGKDCSDTMDKLAMWSVIKQTIGIGDEQNPLRIASYQLTLVKEGLDQDCRAHIQACPRCNHLRIFLGLVGIAEFSKESIEETMEKRHLNLTDPTDYTCEQVLDILPQAIEALITQDSALTNEEVRIALSHLCSCCPECTLNTLHQLININEKYRE